MHHILKPNPISQDSPSEDYSRSNCAGSFKKNLPAALSGGRGGEDAHGGGVVGDEAADIVVRQAAVAVGGPAAAVHTAR
jgi:hypothetical protein